MSDTDLPLVDIKWRRSSILPRLVCRGPIRPRRRSRRAFHGSTSCRPAERSVTDGPFAETKGAVGGFDIIIIERVGRLSGVDIVTASAANGAPEVAWGDTFFIYDPERRLPSAQQFPFATIVTKNYPGFDEASRLDRPGVFRLNIGVSAATFASLFATSAATVDASALDVLVPHPVYGTQHWVVILNPRAQTFDDAVWPLIEEAHERAATRLARFIKGPR